MAWVHTPHRLKTTGLITLADKGRLGAGEHVRVPYKDGNRPVSQKGSSSTHARLRDPGERVNTQSKAWRVPRCRPLRAGQLVKGSSRLNFVKRDESSVYVPDLGMGCRGRRPRQLTFSARVRFVTMARSEKHDAWTARQDINPVGSF
ncbi:hypothetical protein ABT340_39180 [Streptosporangium sp. NPDC000239]|uniref:hypothetical protein n=1 Tax=Streptosporangium sp. NPDC000239 TaxID=3154248 RepID=UPI0033183F97